MNKKFKIFLNILKKKNNKNKRIVVVCPYDEYTIDSILWCYKKRIIRPIFVGEKDKIINLTKNKNIEFELIEAINDDDAIQKGIDLIKYGQGDVLMKGQVDSSNILRSFLSSKNNLKFDNKIISHCSLAYNKKFKRFFLITDAALNIKPTLEQKKGIIENAVNFAHKLDIENVYVANLCAKEKVYEKMQDTIDANELRKMNENGLIKGCVVSGPLQIDLAIDEESAKIKKCADPVAGKANILVCPNIESANIFAKGIVYLGGWTFAGIILGAKVPFVLTSRSTDEEDRILSIILACIGANNE